MLAPFALNLLIACTVLMLTGWASNAATRWVSVSRRSGAVATPAAFDHRARFDREASMVCEPGADERRLAIQTRARCQKLILQLPLETLGME